MSKWAAVQYDGKLPEIVPLNDLREHEEGTGKCWCSPTMDYGVLVHHSMDLREEYEEGRKLS